MPSLLQISCFLLAVSPLSASAETSVGIVPNSWVESANDPSNDFPLQNLPYGVFKAQNRSAPRICVAIGNKALDLNECVSEKLLNGISARTSLNLPDGTIRNFLEDGDEIILRAYAEKDGYPRIGFGECRGVVFKELPNSI